MLAEADRVIHDMKYYGEKKNFGFEAYTQKFYSAFQIKQQYGEAVWGSKQVQDFIAGIEHEKVSAITTPLLGNEKYNSNLQLVAAHIADVARLQGLMRTSKSDPDQHISSLDTSWGDQGSRRRGQSHGRRHGQQQGKRHGHGQGHRGSHVNPTDEEYIPQEALNALTPKQ